MPAAGHLVSRLSVPVHDATPFGDFKSSPRADEEEIQRAQRRLKQAFREDYVDFLRQRNGGEGLIGPCYVALWPVEELYNINEGDGSSWSTDFPGMLLFGSNGGGEAFAFDARSASMPIVMVPFIGDPGDAIFVANDFPGFLEALRRDDLFKSVRKRTAGGDGPAVS